MVVNNELIDVREVLRAQVQLENALELAHLATWEFDTYNKVFIFNVLMMVVGIANNKRKN